MDQAYIKRCLELAQMGEYTVSPNPMVGCVIVREGKIIAEGYHHHPGGPHAEVVAINRVEDPELLKDATLYVSLEPCAHHGRTPPCSDLIVRMGIPEVVIATRDINAAVNGKGIEKLQKAGIVVREGILAEEAREQNRHFFSYHAKQRPYITLKWAQSADGFIDPDRKQNETGIKWISRPESQVFSHQLRARHDAILVGRKTVAIDNPSLDCRAFAGKDPLRIIIDPQAKLNKDFAVFRNEEYLRFCYQTSNPQDRALNPNQDLLPQILNTLYKEGLGSVLIEGGAQTLQAFIDAQLWDEAYVIQSDLNLKAGLKAPKIKGSVSKTIFAKDEILNYRPQ